MKPCTRVGLNLTKRCNWKCSHCFYKHAEDFGTPYDKPLDEVACEMDAARTRGCDHAVAVGWGEPGLYKHIEDWIAYANELKLTTSIITNGTLPPDRYQKLYDIGLNHIHMSCHDIGDGLNAVAGVPTASDNQTRTKEWLSSTARPWRANVTLQRSNYKKLTGIVQNLINYGCKHIILLGFLPHYEWRDRLTEVAVHPKELQPYIEDAIQTVLDAGIYITLRYHPFCHLSPKYWPYVVNARYVLFDPWEWEYEKLSNNIEDVWRAALSLGDAVAIRSTPCTDCDLQIHCGGWNNSYAQAYEGAGLCAVKGLAQDTKVRGYYHDKNPVNMLKGWF